MTIVMLITMTITFVIIRATTDFRFAFDFRLIACRQMRRWQQRLSEKFILKPNQHGQKTLKLYLYYLKLSVNHLVVTLPLLCI